MKIVSNVFDVLEKALKGICILITIAFTLITFASIVARYVFKAPFSWSEQTCRYLFILVCDAVYAGDHAYRRKPGLRSSG